MTTLPFPYACPICSKPKPALASHIYWSHVKYPDLQDIDARRWPQHICPCGFECKNPLDGAAARVEQLQAHLDSLRDPATHLQNYALVDLLAPPLQPPERNYKITSTSWMKHQP